MAVYIDPPRWPAHGTTWSHVVSDASLDELHAFARAAGLPRRSFDLDHYDAPASRFDDLVAAGAIALDAKALVQRLIGSGLRVRPAERAQAAQRQRASFLRDEWASLGQGTDRVAWRALGDELLERWGEQHRRYHDVVHLHDVLLALDQLAVWGEPVDDVARLAAWFHDAVYEGRPGLDERASAELAERRLLDIGDAPDRARRVASIVRATEPGVPPPDDAAAFTMLDADLAILAAGRRQYAAYQDAVRAEYAHVAESDFRRGRASILEGFLEREHIYRTAVGRALWEQYARANLARELTQLRADNA